MRSTLRLAMFVLALAALGLAGTARAQVATLLLKEGDPLPGGPPGHLITSISNSAVNHGGGYAFTVNTSDGVTTLSHAWGAPAGGPGALLLTEATYGIYEQTSWESFFGFGDGGQVAYSPSCTNLDTGTTGLDAVYLGTTKVMIEEEVYPHLAGYWWSFGSRPGVTADGVPYWVSGITDTQGGSTDNRGLFYGLGATPLLLGGNFVAGLPDLDHGWRQWDGDIPAAQGRRRTGQHPCHRAGVHAAGRRCAEGAECCRERRLSPQTLQRR